MIPIQLLGPNEDPVTVEFATARGTALSPTDCVESVGTLTFAPMATRKTVEVQVNGDTVVEPNESFLLNLTNPANAELEMTHPKWKATALDHGVQSYVSERYVPKVAERIRILGGAGKASQLASVTLPS